MERQKSFSFKPTRFLVFSFTICSSVIFLTFFSLGVINFTPPVRQKTHIEFNNGVKPSIVQILSDFSENNSPIGVEKSVLIDSHIRKPQNLSRFATMPDSEEVPLKNHHVEVKEDDKIESVAVNASPKISQENISEIPDKKYIEVGNSEKIVEKREKVCDLTKGKWIFDETYPLYTNNSCPFIDEGFNCLGNGRLNRDYLKWRWQPQDCDIPRFNALKMLELIRGKRLVFVGDSINRNQWESMLCLLMGAIKDPRRVYEIHGRRITKEKGNYSFKFLDYKCTVEYYVTHYLVHESKGKVGQKRVPTLRIDSIDRSSSRWRGADILVFNTANWWTHYKTKAGINYYQEGDRIHPQLDVLVAFKRALMTWASWVEKNINPNKTRVFFRNSAPSHFRGGQWNSGGHCGEVTRPLNETLITINPDKNVITEEVIKNMKIPVTILNVTGLSDYRIDGHPSRYGRKSGKKSIQDCSHWCLPGVPDTWNELLYFHLQSKQNYTSMM